jgi:hypothetical protein
VEIVAPHRNGYYVDRYRIVSPTQLNAIRYRSGKPYKIGTAYRPQVP